MEKNRRNLWRINYSTLLKYFLSYFLLLSALLLCFFVAFRHQLRKIYYTEQDNRIRQNLLLFQQSFGTDLDAVFNIHYNLCENTNLKMLRHSSGSSWYSSLGVRDMRQFTDANYLISDIIYIQDEGNTILACKNYVYKSKNDYYIVMGGKTLKLPVGKYGHENRNSMVYVENHEASALLLFPSTKSTKYDLFYVLDSGEIAKRCTNMLSEEISGIYLTDGDENVISFLGEERKLPASAMRRSYELLRAEEGEDWIYTLPLHANLNLSVRFSKEILMEITNRAFFDLYLVFLVIGGIGLLFILFGMRMTYSPLHRLHEKFTDGQEKKKNLETQLDMMFSSSLQEQKKLQEKIDKYYGLMKESILDTIVNENGEEITDENMERLFNGELNSSIYVVRIAPAEGKVADAAVRDFRDYFQTAFPDNDSFCVCLEVTAEYFSWLIYYGGQDRDKHAVLKELMRDYHSVSRCLVVLSGGSPSPLDIPNLYTSVCLAWSHREQSPVLFCDELEEVADDEFRYPYQELNGFASLLGQMKFREAQGALEHIFRGLEESDYPSFYLRSVLTEMLTTIITDMNQQNIRFSAYNSAYFEALYYIRSFPYKEKNKEIYESLTSLLRVFEEELAGVTIQSGQIQDFMEAHFASSEFSIAMLANQFHISIAYMSYLCKKYFHENFSDHLWNMRMERAKDLLRNTDSSMEDICAAVGYENVSSFRRKFKKELGLTPSQYRSGEQACQD